MSKQTKTQLLFQLLNLDSTPNDIKSNIKDTVFPDYFPYKGTGFISVSDVEKAESILRDHVGEYSFDEYYHVEKNYLQERIGALIEPKGEGSGFFYYGKFEIKDLEGFFHKLYDNGVQVFDYEINPPSKECCNCL